MSFKIKEEMWLYPGLTPWHFITINSKISKKIREVHKGPRRGFGSVRVEATIGKTTWNSSIFPDKKSGTYLLPIKASVRSKENLYAGDIVTLKFNTM
jgi:hypothetical protein